MALPTASTPKLCVSRHKVFSGRRLNLARMRAGLSAKMLAETAGVDHDTITRLVQGKHTPVSDTIARLARVLGYPEQFFFRDDPDEVDASAVSFRSFSKMKAGERDAALSAGSLGLMVNAWVEARFGLPDPDLLDLSHETDPHLAASYLRQHWGVGEQPIGNLLSLFEAKGIRLFSLSENTASVNAFSFWKGGKPFVFLNNFKTAESSRFDAAHELGHLVLHKHGDPKDGRSAEREANAFASSFLMPEADIRAKVPRPVTVDAILRAKVRWRVSAMALAYRLHAIRMVSDWQYKSICIELSRRNFRSAEPGGIERETSVVWCKILRQLWAERISKADIARDLALPLSELEGLIWSLTAPNEVRVQGVASSLRVVE